MQSAKCNVDQMPVNVPCLTSVPVNRIDELLLDQFSLHALQAAMSCFKVLSPIYTYVFLFVRSIVAPPVIAWFCIHLQSAQKLPVGCRYRLCCICCVQHTHIGWKSYSTMQMTAVVLTAVPIVGQSSHFHVRSRSMRSAYFCLLADMIAEGMYL